MKYVAFIIQLLILTVFVVPGIFVHPASLALDLQTLLWVVLPLAGLVASIFWMTDKKGSLYQKIWPWISSICLIINVALIVIGFGGN